MHGVHANRLSMVDRARLLHASGFSVLLFDLQAHGESTGTRITFGHLEAFNAAAAVAYMKSRLPLEKISAIGTSLGGAAALVGPNPLPVDALVLESVYPDIGAVCPRRLPRACADVPGRSAATAAISGFQVRSRRDIPARNSEERAACRTCGW
jgi:pimeloyl-ACP methyl ester carboxylesterase